MAYNRKKYNRKRGYRRKRFYKKKGRHRGMVNLSRQLAQPDSVYCKLRMVKRSSLDAATADVPANFVITASDISDPCLTLGAEQPMGYDQLFNNLYNHFCVWKSQIKVTFIAKGATPGPGTVFCTIRARGDSTAVTDSDEILDSGRGPTKLLTGANAKGTCVLKYGYNHSKWFNQPVTKSREFYGSNATAPDDNIFYHISVLPVDASEEPVSIWMMIEMTYYCLFTERKDLSVSTA